MTYRDRRLRKAERLRAWAARREQRAAAAFTRAETISSGIPMGQPILVGHHSEKRHRRDVDRIHTSMSAGVAHAKKADEMRGRADGIEHQADRAIYHDDPDALERLRERIAELEARRARMKAINATIRKGPGWEARIAPALTDDERGDLLRAAQYNNTIGYPAYALQNISGNLTRQKQRLATLETEAIQRARVRATLAAEREEEEVQKSAISRP